MRKILLIVIGLILSILLVFVFHEFTSNLIEQERIKNATVIVELSDDLTAEFKEEKYVSDFITYINGEIDDYKIDTTNLGSNTILFSYVNEENITIKYSFQIEVLDVTAPLIWLSSSYTVNTNFNGDLTNKIMCIDDTDDNPECYIEGEYDTNTLGSYSLTYVGIDASGNKEEVPFTLIVKKAGSSSSNGSASYLNFDEALELFKTDNTSLGIDISTYQGNIDYEKVKDSGVEFVIIRVGSKKGTDGEYFLDDKFIQNIEGFNNVGISVGVYFYSYAKSDVEAMNDALWVISQIKDYDIDLPVAFDFENWTSINSYHLSMYSLNNIAKTFINTLNEAGYEGMLYGSVSYLNKIWYKDEFENVWLAHYSLSQNYEGECTFWQFSASGKVNGIDGAVDLDIMYK